MSINELSAMNDADLSRQVQMGTTNALYVLHERKDKMLLHFLRSKLHDHFKVGEADQKTWIKAWQYSTRHPEEKIRDIDKWLRTIAFRVAFPRKSKLLLIPLDETAEAVKDSSPDEFVLLSSKEEHEIFEEHLCRLPRRMQQLVRLRLAGNSFPAIEKIMNLRKHSGSSRYSKAQRQLLLSFGIEEENVKDIL